MSNILSAIDSKVYKLQRIDSVLSSYNIRTISFYANAGLTDDFMPSQTLEEAFYQTVVEFPLLTGHLNQVSGGWIEAVVDKTCLNVPDYRESQSDIHFRDIKSAKYNPATWPDNLIPFGAFACPGAATGTIKLVSAHVVRLKDNSGVIISLNINHGIVDGYSFLLFFNRWADQTRALVSHRQAEPLSICLDRSAILQYLPSEREPLSDWLVWLSPSTRGRLLSYLGSMAPTCGHLFRISREQLSRLRNQVLECMPAGARLTTNDVLTALVYKVHGQAKFGVAATTRRWSAWGSKGDVEANSEHALVIACDLRGRLGMEGINFIGNAQLSGVILNPMKHGKDTITPQILADIAAQIHSVVSNLSSPYIGSYVDFLESESFNTGALIAAKMKYGLYTLTTNMMHRKLYGADFGNGVQAFSTVAPNYPGANAIFLASPPPSTDILINFTAAAKEMDHILKNAFWRDITTLVY
ncbi:hypothetical protein DL89DRAFT_255504 [Linderina pennispora]|uniref:Transferase-domain-containing protein n=1 Tax=Linderina pennispora TaxID=61395 RepID=A0A1Y1WEE0_9FUNG|nr:uncharacterized protein DL89DRAFT_255504 [Linderina pennispora]ORX71765.1 hypothetical protein DL89DRAFT_255504 [Linderina pennispora]